MSVDLTICLTILGCALVTLLPRVVPFLVVKNMPLPAVVTKWLTFIPVCILTALVVDSMLHQDESGLSIDWPVVIVVAPTLLVAIWTKSLSVTVIAGIVLMAVTRYVGS